MFNCDKCDKVLSTKGNLKRHLLGAHDKIKDFKCTSCVARFYEKSHLHRHIKTVHDNIKDHKCAKCDCMFSSRSHLKRHINQVHLRPAESKRMSLGEFKIQTILKKFSLPFKQEQTFNDLQSDKNRKLRFDFALPLNDSFLLIEFDGKQHFEKVGWTTQESDQQIADHFNYIQKCDRLKNEYALKHGYPLLRVRYDDKNVQDTILNFLIINYDADLWKTYD